MKNKNNHNKVLAVYLLPWFYFAMWLDITCRPPLPYVLLPYIITVAILLILRIYLGKAGKLRLALKGLLLNAVVTNLCVLILQQNNLDRWHSYFGPFFPLPLIAIIIVAEIFIYAIKDNR